MAEETVTLTSSQPDEVVLKTVEDSLTQLGQCTVTKKGSITINPKSKYNTFFVQTDTMEGTIRKKRDSQFEVGLNYKCSPTTANWFFSIFFGLMLIFPVLLLLIPYLAMPKTVKKDIQMAMIRAQQDLE